jgi:hypothetical protein
MKLIRIVDFFEKDLLTLFHDGSDKGEVFPK